MDNSAVYTEGKKVSTKFMAVVFLYMFMGLAITGLTGFLFALWLTKSFSDGAGALSETGYTILLFSAIGAWIIALIDSFILPFVAGKSGRAPWFGYILYALCVGVGFSIILLAGVSFAIIGEAFGLTALVFLIMFLIGYFSKADLTPLAFVGIALLVGIFAVSLFWGVWIAIAYATGSYGTYLLIDYGISAVLIVVMMLFIAYDANRMAKIADQGMATTNTALYCAFTLYGDFIVLFVRILYILLATQSRR
jgi:FtsH-binding integral membrane protein